MHVASGYLELLGVEPASPCEAGPVRFDAVAGPALRNPDGHVHGGVLASLLGEGLLRAAGGAVRGELVEMRVAYLRATAATRLVVEAGPVRSGRRLSFVQARVCEPDGREVAAAGVVEPRTGASASASASASAGAREG